MDIEKSLNKIKTPTPSNDNENQDDIQEVVNDTTSDSAKKNRDRAGARTLRLNKT